MSWRKDITLITNNICIGDADDFDEANDPDEATVCDCRPKHAGAPLCFDSRCVNFALQYECVTHSSPAYGALCQNQRIQKRKWANLEVRETPGRGYGLFVVDGVRKGEYLIEYFGEVITHAEHLARIERAKHETHMYLLQVRRR